MRAAGESAHKRVRYEKDLSPEKEDKVGEETTRGGTSRHTEAVQAQEGCSVSSHEAPAVKHTTTGGDVWSSETTAHRAWQLEDAPEQRQQQTPKPQQCQHQGPKSDKEAFLRTFDPTLLQSEDGNLSEEQMRQCDNMWRVRRVQRKTHKKDNYQKGQTPPRKLAPMS